MKVNNISFGSTFKFNTKALQQVSSDAQSRVASALSEYAGVSKKATNNLFGGVTDTLTVNDGNDNIVLGFFKTIGVIPERLKP